MKNENIDLMIKNKIFHSNICLLEEISYSDEYSSYGYGEYNGKIIDCINENAPDGPFALICDNVIKFIDYKPSKNENDHYKSIIQKEFNFRFDFSYNIISRAFNNHDLELLDLEWNRIDKELDKLLQNPYLIFGEDEQGIAVAIMLYFNESIGIYNNIYKEEKVMLLEGKLKKLKSIYHLI